MNRQVHGLLKCLVITVSIGSYLTVTTYGAFAQTITADQAIAAGQSVGAAGFGQLPVGVDRNGNLTIPNGKGPPISLSPSELSQTNGASYSAGVGNISSVYGSNTAMSQAGVNAQANLSTGNAAPNQAYQTLLSVKQNGVGNLTANDPIFAAATGALSNTNLMSAFAACNPTTTSAPSMQTVHVPSYVTCDVANPIVSNYTVNHTYNYPVSPISIANGTGTVTSCGTGCVNITIGTPTIRYYDVGPSHVGCQMFTVPVALNITAPAAISQATVNQVNWDDRMTIALNGNQIWADPNSNGVWWNPTTQGVAGCDLVTSWSATPNLDITSTLQAGGTVNVLLTVQVGGGGDGWINIQVTFDPSQVPAADVWSPSQYVAAIANPDAECSVTNLSCSIMPATDASGCATVNGGYVCPSMMSSSPFAGISPLCQQVQATVNCTQFDVGQGDTYQTGQGQSVTLTSNGSTPNGCLQYSSNPACVFQSQSCVEGAQGATTGTCYVQAQVWDCGTTAQVKATTTTTNQNCAGPVQCMGTSCSSTSQVTNSNFGTAYAALQAVQGMQQDSNCVAGGNSAGCSIFPGTALTCKKAVGGIVDCCKTPVPVSFVTYVQTLVETHSAYTTAQSIGLLGQDAPDLSVHALTNQLGDALGMSDSPGNPSLLNQASDLVDNIESEIQTDATQWLSDTFGQEAADEIVTDMVTDIIPGLQVIMLAYTIYQIAMMVIQLIWQCEASEQQLATEIADKQCHYLGTYCASKVLGVCVETKDSYCCFSSPLSRILQEQIRMQPQVGVSWGTAQLPNCQALTMAELGQVNWSQVNLSEWIAMLNIANVGTASLQLSADGLTGAGSYVSQATGQTQPNAVTRAIGNATTLTSAPSQ